MNKVIIAIACLMSTSFASNAQVKKRSSFDWVTAAQSMMMTYKDMEALPDGGTIALAERSPVNFISMDILFMQGDGTKYPGWDLTRNHAATLLMRFDDKGMISWVHETRSQFAHIYKISVSDAGEVDLLVKIYEQERNESNEPIGYYFDEDDDAIPAGYGIVTVDKNGYFSSHRPIKYINEDVDPEFYQFEHHGKEILINGFMEEGKLTSNLETTAGSSGGDFILAIDENGIPTWADVVSSSKQSCCTIAEESKFDVAPDGTIYFGGMYPVGGIFSNGKETLAPTKYDPNGKKYTWETYVVCYSPDRKIKWIETVGSESRFGALVATDDGVFVGYNSYGNKSFGKRIDTTSNSTTVLTYLNSKGKLQWNRVTELKSFESMQKGLNNQLIISGRCEDRQSETPRKFGDFEFGPKDELFVASLNSDGKVKQFWSADLWTSREKVFVSQDAKGSVYVALETHCGLSIDMNLVDGSFPNIKCYGGSPVLGTIKLK